jgi:alkylation response protein AidB-like acyl-CoA dehydrogenase
MDFNPDTETNILKSNAEKYLREKCSPAAVKQTLEEEPGFSPTIWKEIAELGWLGLVYPMKYGGSEGRFLDLYTLFVEIGRAVMPSPFFASAVLAGFVIGESGDEKAKSECLPGIISGEKICTLGLIGERGRYDFEEPALEAETLKDGTYRLSGTRLLVDYAHVADEILVCAAVKGSGPTLFRIRKDAKGKSLTPLDTLTKERTFAVAFDAVGLRPEDVVGQAGKGHTYIRAALPRAIVLKCGEMLGGLERVVDMTVQYMKERKQFGRALGTLQAVQHRCADMQTLLMGTRLTVGQAASLLSEGRPADKEIAMAKAWASDAYKACTWTAHQLHGGIGFTQEHDLHLYYKHAKACELAFGGSLHHRRTLADLMGI